MSLAADLDDVCHALILLGSFQELGTQGNFPKRAVPSESLRKTDQISSPVLMGDRWWLARLPWGCVEGLSTGWSSVCTYSNRPRPEAAAIVCPFHTCGVLNFGELGAPVTVDCLPGDPGDPLPRRC